MEVQNRPKSNFERELRQTKEYMAKPMLPGYLGHFRRFSTTKKLKMLQRIFHKVQKTSF